MRITNKEQLAAHGNREGRKIVAELLDAGLDALDPYVRVKQLVHVENGKIVLHTDGFEMKGDPHAGPLEFDLKDYDRVYVIGAAKGVQRAALAMEEALGDVLTGGHVISEDMGRKLDSATLDDLGQAHQVRITKDNTTIVDGAGDKDAIRHRVEQIKEQLKETTSQFDKDKLQELYDEYFQIEKGIYEKLLSNPDEVVSGTVKELAEKYGQDVLTLSLIHI